MSILIREKIMSDKEIMRLEYRANAAIICLEVASDLFGQAIKMLEFNLIPVLKKSQQEIIDAVSKFREGEHKDTPKSPADLIRSLNPQKYSDMDNEEIMRLLKKENK